MKTIAKAIFYPFFRVYFIVRSWNWVWLYFLNSSGRRMVEDRATALSPVEKRIVDDLLLDGIAITHLDELFPGGNQLQTLTAYTNSLMGSAETKTNKAFLQQLWDVVPMISLQNPFLKLMLSKSVLSIVNNYHKVASLFYYFTLNVTTPVPANSPEVASQRWHRDPEDKKMCKVFIYLNDVDENAGPFTFISGTQYGGRYGELFPQKVPKGVYPPTEEVERAIPKSENKICTGKAGTIIFADTAGLHKGGYAKSGKRIMFTAGFCTRASVWPIRFAYDDNFKNEVEHITDEEARYALMVPPPTFSQKLFEKLKKVYK